MFTRDELEAVLPLVHAAVPPTPQYAWPLLKARTGVDVVVKHENHTPTGAFKVRGGIVYADRLKRERPHVKGVVTATRGNHGQSLAFACARAGVPCTVVVPFGNSTEKNAAMQAFGAMGMTKELPLQLMQAKLRTMRIYDGPTEVHKWVVARNLLGTRR